MSVQWYNCIEYDPAAVRRALALNEYEALEGGNMLTERLQELMAKLEQLTAEEQERMADVIAAELDEETRWQQALTDSHDLVLDKLLAQAKEQAARGEALDLDELL